MSNVVDENGTYSPEAERTILGTILHVPDALDSIYTLRPNHFYDPKHMLLFESIQRMNEENIPISFMSVISELASRDLLQKVGGRQYILGLRNEAVQLSTLNYYSNIISNKASQRKLLSFFQKGLQTTQQNAGYDITSLLADAQSELDDIADKAVKTDLVSSSESLAETLDEIEALSNMDGSITGVPTGFVDLDDTLAGLHPGQMVIVAARPAIGKALDVNTLILTPNGWTTMGDIQPGDYVYGSDGKPTKVVNVSELMKDRRTLKVVFDDDSMIVADENHLWTCNVKMKSGKTRVISSVTTGKLQEMLENIVDDSADYYDITVSNTNAVEYGSDDIVLPVDPYRLGVWLSDNGLDETLIDVVDGLADVVDNDYDYSQPTIPQIFQHASVEDRVKLLKGLTDSVGSVDGDIITLPLTSAALSDDIYELIVSLGLSCLPTIVDKHNAVENCGVIYQLQYCLAVDGGFERSLVEILENDDPDVVVKCIEVEAANHLFLAGEAMVPTHNSTLGLDFARSAALHNGRGVLMFSLEMSRIEITMRMISAECRIPLQKLKTGDLEDYDWERISKKMPLIDGAPLYIDDTPELTTADIRAKARRFKQRNDLGLIIVDYLQLMTPVKRFDSREREVSEMSRSLKLLAKELEVPVIVICQLNRGPEQRAEKKPQSSDLRESGSLEQDADVILLLYREEAVDPDSTRVGEADIIVAKQRNGPTRTVTVAFHGHLSRFANLMKEPSEVG